MRYKLTNAQAKRFILLKQGLLGEYKFIGKQGAYEYVQQAGCVQFDPIDVCSKNAELVFQSRVKGFTKQQLWELLYEDRRLIDYYDKNMAIWCKEDWRYFQRIRNDHKRWNIQEIDEVSAEIKRIAHEKGFICSKDLPYDQKINWAWSPSRLSRAALELLYFRGELIIHHKKGTVKYYSLAEDFLESEILQAQNPFASQAEEYEWLAFRRIGAVGMLWNRASDAWLGSNVKTADRQEAFDRLIKDSRIIECDIEGIEFPCYIKAEDIGLLNRALSDEQFKQRTELIAPLDCFMWDRNLIEALFGFQYRWEIYTPVDKRKYGYYVLPILQGEDLVGRVEAVADKKQGVLIVKGLWKEQGKKLLMGEYKKCMARFASFNGCAEVLY